jgi:hypothetical protein
MRLFGLVLCFWCVASVCFAYKIEPYSEQFISEDQVILNLVFSSLNYQRKGDFLRDLNELIQRLRQTKPFDEIIDKIRINYIILSKEEENMVFKHTQGFPPLKVRQDFLRFISTHLRPNYKLVIVDALGSVSCAELSFIEKVSLVIVGKARYDNSPSFAKGFLHELGHSLGLRDECVDCGELSPPGPPNCAATKEEAEKWWDDLVGKDPRVNYISGCCGNKNYIRPTIASLMDNPDKAEDFGSVNERYLREILKRY